MYQNLTLNKFLSSLAEPTAVPGGGSAAALSGAMSAALGAMVTGLTIKKLGKGKKTVRPAIIRRLRYYHREFVCNRQTLLKLTEEDARAYKMVYQALRLPKDTPKQKHQRRMNMQKALCYAAKIPYQVMNYAVSNLWLINKIIKQVSSNMMSDIGVAVLLSQSSLNGAYLNVRINLDGISNRSITVKIDKQCRKLLRKARGLNKDTGSSFNNPLNPP